MKPFPYFVPGVPSGEERRDLETLEALVRDLRRYADGGLPSEADLAGAPVVSGWLTVGDASSVRIAGEVSSHPRVGPGPAVTSRIYAMGHRRDWVRSYSRLWRLGPPLPTARRGDA